MLSIILPEPERIMCQVARRLGGSEANNYDYDYDYYLCVCSNRRSSLLADDPGSSQVATVCCARRRMQRGAGLGPRARAPV